MKRTLWMRAALVAVFCVGLHGTALAAPDAWITTKVKLALLTADDVSGTAINVDTFDGRVTLQGDVPTAAEKARVESVAAGIDGVTQVRNLLAIVPPDADEQRERAVEKQEMKDDDLKTAVENALEKDAALANSSVTVDSVSKGVVTLDGSAKTMSDELRAIETARAVPGVRSVKDDIDAPETLSDTEVWSRDVAAAGASVATSASDVWLTSAVKVKLIANDQTPAGDINVDTRNGVVTLFGMVPSQDASRVAEATAKETAGVRGVDNELQVVAAAERDQVKATDEQIKERVETRFDDTPNTDIGVEVSGGVVRLSGTVPSQVDRLQALSLARAITGVRSVVDELQVAAK